MSQIITALKKAQEQRQGKEETSIIKPIHQQTKEMGNIKDDAFSKIMTITIITSIVSIVLACMISFLGFNLRKNELAGLIAITEKQEKEINNLTKTLNKNKNNLDTEIRKVNARLDQNATDLKIKYMKLVVNTDEHYVKLKESMLENQKQMKTLIKDVTNLKNKFQDNASDTYIKNGEVR